MEGECQGSKMYSYSMVNVHVHILLFLTIGSCSVPFDGVNCRPGTRQEISYVIKKILHIYLKF